MDAIDHKIIDTLLDDARTPYARIADELGLATATVHQRVKRLRETGVIAGFTVRLDWSRLDLPVAALVSISVTSRRPLATVAEQLRTIPWVVACAAVSGQFDLLVHVRAQEPGTPRRGHRRHPQDGEGGDPDGPRPQPVLRSERPGRPAARHRRLGR